MNSPATGADIQRPLVSVVIPAWNHAKELRGCLASLLRQTHPRLEILVVDDGSSDNPHAAVDEFRGSLDLKFIRFAANRGAAAARNEGARGASGEYLLFVDADAVLAPHCISAMVEALEKNPAAVFAYSAFRFGWKRFKSRPFDAEQLRLRPYIHTTALLRRTAFPGFDETLKKFQDWDLWLTVAERGGQGVWLPEELFTLKVRRQGISRWLPSFFHMLPWEIIGWMPRELKNYRRWEGVVKQKHGIPVA